VRPPLQKAESLANEKNRALRAAMNAEFRKEKALLQQEVMELQSLVRGKKTSPEVEQERMERLQEAAAAVDEIPDSVAGGSTLKPQRGFGTNGSSSYNGGTVNIDGSGMNGTKLDYPEAYQHTEETSEFVRDASMARDRQDLALDNIERGLSTLKELGAAMGEELERHDVVIDEVETKMDAVTKELQTNNMKLKGLVTKVRSTRKFFIDIILICILLAVGLYIYNMVK